MLKYMEAKKSTLVLRHENVDTYLVNLKKENEMLKTSIDTSYNIINEKNYEIQNISKKFENINNINNDYYKINRDLSEELTTAKETVDLLKVQLKHLQNDNDELSKNIQKSSLVQEKLEFMEQEYRVLSKTESNLRGEVLTLRANQDDNILNIQELEKNSENYKKKLENNEILLEEKIKEIEVYYTVIKKMENVLDDTNKNYYSVKDILSSKEEQLSELFTELSETKEMLAEYQSMNNDLIDSKNVSEAKLKKLENEMFEMNEKFQTQLVNMRNTNNYNQEIENKLLVTMNELDEKNNNFTQSLIDYQELEQKYKNAINSLKDYEFISVRYETLKTDIIRERVDLNAEIENLQSSVITLNKALTEKDDYIYCEEELHRQQLTKNHNVIEKLLKENKNLSLKEQEVINLTQLLDETNANLLSKTKLFEETVIKLQNDVKTNFDKYNEENIKCEALIIQVREDFNIIKRLQNGLDINVGELNEYAVPVVTANVPAVTIPIPTPTPTYKNVGGRIQKRKFITNVNKNHIEKEPVVTEVKVDEKRNSFLIDNLLKSKMENCSTNTELTYDNIELLFETEQSHLLLNDQYSDLKASYDKLKQTTERLSKSCMESNSKVEKLSKDNKSILERYDIKVSELTDIIEQDEKEISRLNKEHNNAIKKYENQLEDLEDTIKHYEKSINEFNIFKDEQDSICLALNETIKSQKLELMSMKNQTIVQKTHETNIMENYNEQLKKNEEISKENKNLKLNIYENENSIQLFKSKIETITKHNAELIENDNEHSKILKEQYLKISELTEEKENFEKKYNIIQNNLNEDYILIKEHKNIIARYKEELKNLVDENTEYGISETAYKESIKQYQNEIEQLSIQLSKNKTSHKLLQQHLQEMQYKEQKNKENLKILEETSENYKYEIVTLKDDLSSKSVIINDMMGDKETLQNMVISLENNKKENQRLQEELEEQTNLKDTITADCETKNQEINKLNELCNEYKLNISSLKDALNTSNKSLESLSSLSQQIEELENEKKAMEQKHIMQLNEIKNNFVIERSSMKDLEKDLNDIIEEKESKLRSLEKELWLLNDTFENNRNMLEKYQKNHEKSKNIQNTLKESIETYERKIQTLEMQLIEQSNVEMKLHDEINILEQDKKSYGIKLADAIRLEQEKAKENIVTIMEDSEEIKKLQKKIEVQTSLIQKLRDSEKALRDNDNLMQDDIKNIISEKETLRDEVSKLKQLNNNVLMRIKKQNEEKQNLEQSCETLKSTIINYVETINKMSKNEYDHDYLRNEIHNQEKKFAAFI